MIKYDFFYGKLWVTYKTDDGKQWGPSINSTMPLQQGMNIMISFYQRNADFSHRLLAQLVSGKFTHGQNSRETNDKYVLEFQDLATKYGDMGVISHGQLYMLLHPGYSDILYPSRTLLYSAFCYC